jgi:hypothetical protein
MDSSVRNGSPLSKRPVGADYVIVADPEGNRFCVVDVSRR